MKKEKDRALVSLRALMMFGWIQKTIFIFQRE